MSCGAAKFNAGSGPFILVYLTSSPKPSIAFEQAVASFGATRSSVDDHVYGERRDVSTNDGQAGGHNLAFGEKRVGSDAMGFSRQSGNERMTAIRPTMWSLRASRSSAGIHHSSCFAAPTTWVS
jgi:hypothetical protein